MGKHFAFFVCVFLAVREISECVCTARVASAEDVSLQSVRRFADQVKYTLFSPL